MAGLIMKYFVLKPSAKGWHGKACRVCKYGCGEFSHGQDNSHGLDEKAPKTSLGDKAPVQKSTLSISNGLRAIELRLLRWFNIWI